MKMSTFVLIAIIIVFVAMFVASHLPIQIVGAPGMVTAPTS